MIGVQRAQRSSRERDFDVLRMLVRERMVEPAVPRDRLDALSLAGDHIERPRARLASAWVSDVGRSRVPFAGSDAPAKMLNPR